MPWRGTPQHWHLPGSPPRHPVAHIPVLAGRVQAAGAGRGAQPGAGTSKAPVLERTVLAGEALWVPRDPGLTSLLTPGGAGVGEWEVLPGLVPGPSKGTLGRRARVRPSRGWNRSCGWSQGRLLQLSTWNSGPSVDNVSLHVRSGFLCRFSELSKKNELQSSHEVSVPFGNEIPINDKYRKTKSFVLISVSAWSRTSQTRFRRGWRVTTFP